MEAKIHTVTVHYKQPKTHQYIKCNTLHKTYVEGEYFYTYDCHLRTAELYLRNLGHEVIEKTKELKIEYIS